MPEALRALLLFALVCASSAAFAQDSPGLGIGLALVFIVLPILLPVILVGTLVWIVWRLWKGAKDDKAQGNC
jgi:hypothetical protein